MSAVSRNMRHLKSHPCPVCNGADQDHRGAGKRCSGFTSADGDWTHCSREELAGAIDQNDAGLFAHKMRGSCKCGTTHDGDGRAGATLTEIASYQYRDAAGSTQYEVVRFIQPNGEKTFRQRRPGGTWGRGDTPRILYRLPELLADDGDCAVFVVEGEKDVDALVKRGLTATCNPEGAGKFHYVADQARKMLAGRDVVIIADRDKPGEDHARDVHAHLRGVTRSVAVMQAPAPHKDVSDLFSAGGTLERLVPMMLDEAPADAATPEPSSSEEMPPTNGFRLWEPAKIWEPLPPPDYLVDGLFVRGSLGLLVAYGSSLKTWLAMALLLASATGSDWLGRSCRQAEVCLIDFESGDYELRRRVQMIARGHGYATPIAGFTFASMPDVCLAEDAFFEAIEPLARRFGIIVVDSLAAGSGGVDENDARFARPLQRLKAIASKTGCVIILIHHSRKTTGDGKTDEREMVRGSSAIFNAVDVVLGLTRGEEGLFVVRQSKARGGKSVEPFTVRVDDVGPDACRVTAGSFHEEQGAAGSSSRTLQIYKTKILQLLATEKDLKSGSAVFRRTKGRKATVLGALDELQELELVVVHEGAFRLRSEVEC